MSGRGTAGGPVIRPSRNLIVFCVDCSCTAVARCSFHPATYLSTRNRIWQDSKSDPFSKWWKVMLIFNAIIVGSLIQTKQCQGILYGYAVQVESQSSIRIFNRVIFIYSTRNYFKKLQHVTMDIYKSYTFQSALNQCCRFSAQFILRFGWSRSARVAVRWSFALFDEVRDEWMTWCKEFTVFFCLERNWFQLAKKNHPL